MTTRPLQQTAVRPVATRRMADGTLFVDFGKAAFGTLDVPSQDRGRQGVRVVHLGEQLTPEGRVERRPAGTIRYIRIEQAVDRERDRTRVAIPADPRNTGPAAIRMPAEIGEVFPFRYAEIEDADGLEAEAVRQICVHYPFDDTASAFASSDTVLDAVYDLCKYSIKATSFCGVYVDGDRERIPYEGDAYINQLCHYCVDREYALARHTHEYLILNPTWPTEWHLHSVMMAWADYLYTGETVSLKEFYGDLCIKTLIDLSRGDGLISTQSAACTREFEERLHLHGRRVAFKGGLRDLVDWPPGSFTQGGTGERDNHEMLPINTVVNAFHCHALDLMARIARVLGHAGDAQRFAARAERVGRTINRLLFDRDRGVYVDGEGSRHASLHSNMFMLAFNLVPEDRKGSVVAFVKSRGMACSVYGAQHLLEALYMNHEDQAALELMTAQHDRSWWNMIRVGSTITLEAWDLRYKNNLDWNHAWGAAPANIIARYVLGVRPLTPGFREILIQPQPGSLTRASGTVPTPHGSVAVAFERQSASACELRVVIPPGSRASVGLKQQDRSTTILVDGRTVEARPEGGYVFLDALGEGPHVLRHDGSGSR